MDVRKELYIGGRWVQPAGQGDIDVIDSRTEDVMGRVPRGGGADVERAAAAARTAFPAWSQTPVADRVAALRALADGLEARGEQLAEMMSREVGTPIAISRRVQVGLSVDVFRSIAGIAADFPLETRIGTSLLVRQPAGVVAAITPWNYPLYQLAAKLAPALAAGCTIILKPAGAAPLAAFVLAEVIDGLGLPPGTVNVISGPGSQIGEMLAAHPDVDMVSITGSTQAGVRVAQAAAQTVKRVTLELGGKSAFILLDDTDLAAALPVAVRSCFVNNGQTCSALTRLIVPRPLLAEVEEGLAELIGAMRVGDPLDPGTDLGPVLAVLAADGEDEAVRIANDSEYGLAGGVWSADQDRAIAVARRLRTGQVAVNGGRFNVRAPFGGYRASGVGRELGEHGLAEYFELTSLQLPAPRR